MSNVDEKQPISEAARPPLFNGGIGNLPVTPLQGRYERKIANRPGQISRAAQAPSTSESISPRRPFESPSRLLRVESSFSRGAKVEGYTATTTTTMGSAARVTMTVIPLAKSRRRHALLVSYPTLTRKECWYCHSLGMGLTPCLV